MCVRWTAPAAQDLYQITRHIRRDNPTAALEVAKALYDGGESLVNMPHRGRKGHRPATRELVFVPLQFKMPPDFVKSFKQEALNHGMKLNGFLKYCFDENMKIRKALNGGCNSPNGLLKTLQ